MPESTPAETKMSPAAQAAAVLALIVFVALIAFLLFRLAMPQEEWDRAMVLFGSFETLVFAAAAFLFGREVNRAQVQEAKREAVEAKTEAEKKEKQKTEAVSQKEHERNRADFLQARGQELAERLGRLVRQEQERGGQRSSFGDSAERTDVLPDLQALYKDALAAFGASSGLVPPENAR